MVIIDGQGNELSSQATTRVYGKIRMHTVSTVPLCSTTAQCALLCAILRYCGSSDSDTSHVDINTTVTELARLSQQQTENEQRLLVLCALFSTSAFNHSLPD